MRAHSALWATLVVLSTFAAGPADAGVFRSADESVRRFFHAIQTDDERLYGSVAPRIVLMAAPDFGVPMPLGEAREAFAKCTVLSVSQEKPLAEMKGFKSATAKLTCPIDGLGALDVEFISRRGELVSAYPGGLPPPNTGGHRPASGG